MRIVSLAPSNTEILFALGCGSEIVGVSNVCDYPVDVFQIPKVGGWINPDCRKIMKLRPDIVFTSGFLQQPVVDELRLLGAEVFHVDPRSLKDVLHSFKEIGAMVSKRKQANELVKEFNSKLKKARKHSKKRVLCLEWLKPFMASGNWVPELLEKINCESLLKKGEISREFTPQELKNFNPNAIVLNVCGAGYKVNPELVLIDSFFASTLAVKRGKVFVLHDSMLNRPGPRLADGLVELSKALK
ncbi:cobalamin-binding protein [Candidatus Micrarchaeota archaeon]|nr:cobalamin-binding protein [Candidatus Micrarchaeota archaeon]